MTSAPTDTLQTDTRTLERDLGAQTPAAEHRTAVVRDIGKVHEDLRLMIVNSQLTNTQKDALLSQLTAAIDDAMSSLASPQGAPDISRIIANISSQVSAEVTSNQSQGRVQTGVVMAEGIMQVQLTHEEEARVAARVNTMSHILREIDPDSPEYANQVRGLARELAPGDPASQARIEAHANTDQGRAIVGTAADLEREHPAEARAARREAESDRVLLERVLADPNASAEKKAMAREMHDRRLYAVPGVGHRLVLQLANGGPNVTSADQSLFRDVRTQRQAELARTERDGSGAPGDDNWASLIGTTVSGLMRVHAQHSELLTQRQNDDLEVVRTNRNASVRADAEMRLVDGTDGNNHVALTQQQQQAFRALDAGTQKAKATQALGAVDAEIQRLQREGQQIRNNAGGQTDRGSWFSASRWEGGLSRMTGGVLDGVITQNFVVQEFNDPQTLASLNRDPLARDYARRLGVSMDGASMLQALQREGVVRGQQPNENYNHWVDAVRVQLDTNGDRQLGPAEFANAMRHAALHKQMNNMRGSVRPEIGRALGGADGVLSVNEVTNILVRNNVAPSEVDTPEELNAKLAQLAGIRNPQVAPAQPATARMTTQTLDADIAASGVNRTNWGTITYVGRDGQRHNFDINNPDHLRQQLADAGVTLSAFDRDHNGHINGTELTAALNSSRGHSTPPAAPARPAPARR